MTAKNFLGYVIGTQQNMRVKVRVPREQFLKKYGKWVTYHTNYQVYDETGQCLVGDIVKVKKTPRISERTTHIIADIVKPAERFIDPKTKFVYTNGFLNIPVGYVDEKTGKIVNRIPTPLYQKMGLL
jgi:small subunit ribosomal protein S17